MAKTKIEKQQEDEATRVGQYVQDFNDHWKYVTGSYHPKWFNCYSVYSGRRVKVGYNSVADSFVPETRTIVESLVANIAGGAPKFGYIATMEEQEADTEVLTELMSYYWDCNHMSVKAQSWVRDSIIYGTGILHVSWDAVKNMPVVDNVPLRDFIIDPTATSLETARYVGFRYLADLENLKKMKVINPEWKEGDPEEDKLIPMYKNLDKVTTGAIAGQDKNEMDKQKKEQLIGSTLGTDNTRQVEMILLYYTDTNKVVEIANRSVLAREEDTPYQSPERVRDVELTIDGVPQMVEKTIEAIDAFVPFAILRNTIDPSLFYGTGDVEVIMDRQEVLNDVENLDLDNLHFLNNVMWRIDPAYEDMAAEIESTPGIVIPIPRNALEPLEKPTITNDLDNKKMEIKEEMRRATAADEIMQGSTTERGRATATEISTVATNAQARFKTKVTNLESEGFAQLGSVLFKMVQIFQDKKTVVRIVGEDGTTFKDFDPYEFAGYYEPHVRLDSTIKDQKIEQGQKLNQMYQILLNNPVVDQREAVRFIMKTLGADEDDVKRMLAVPQMGGMPGGMPGAPTDPSNPMLSSGEQMYDPAIAGAMQAREEFALQGGMNEQPGQPVQ